MTGVSQRVSERRVVDFGGLGVVLVDSITQILAEDAGRVVVSGSHGGTSAAFFAVRVPARLYVFNDAGIGKDRAGIRGLEVLERAGIAACVVSHDSARIGDAADTLHSGVVSTANERALNIGIEPGLPIACQLAALSGEDRSRAY
ncbi:hypothetical protein FQ775_04175 [Nitratireductor mangrovi]|uniref:Uncharacterized protein n=1 Tax=Nitratireductor mangrovi TaxID=2599600 RepID=A0A5B8KVJ7_9HYPH|nr:hypothetical protein FQ775_04175 [Nitratireductor mangrovi]